MTRLLLCSGLVFASATVVLAQPAPNGGGIAPTGTPNFNRTTTEQPITTQNANQSHEVSFISGKVVLEDGSTPPESVVIERICGPVHRIEARTDAKGQFSFQAGKNVRDTEQLLDVSADYGRIPGTLSSAGPNATGSGGKAFDDGTDLRGCELHAALPGYQSKNVDLSMHNGTDSPDVGVIILKRLGGREGNTISVTNAMAPKDAKKAFDKARQAIAKGNLDEARKELSKATGIYPKYASAWVELGRLQMAAKEWPAARQSFRKALDADPKYLPPYERLATLELQERSWRELADTTDRLIQLNAYDYPQAYYYNALAELNLGHPDVAEKNAREALKLDPQRFAPAGYVLGLALAQKGQFTPAAELLRAYLATNPPAAEATRVKAQLADLEKQAPK